MFVSQRLDPWGGLPRRAHQCVAANKSGDGFLFCDRPILYARPITEARLLPSRISDVDFSPNRYTYRRSTYVIFFTLSNQFFSSTDTRPTHTPGGPCTRWLREQLGSTFLFVGSGEHPSRTRWYRPQGRRPDGHSRAGSPTGCPGRTTRATQSRRPPTLAPNASRGRPENTG